MKPLKTSISKTPLDLNKRRIETRRIVYERLNRPKLELDIPEGSVKNMVALIEKNTGKSANPSILPQGMTNRPRSFPLAGTKIDIEVPSGKGSVLQVDQPLEDVVFNDPLVDLAVDLQIILDDRQILLDTLSEISNDLKTVKEGLNTFRDMLEVMSNVMTSFKTEYDNFSTNAVSIVKDVISQLGSLNRNFKILSTNVKNNCPAIIQTVKDEVNTHVEKTYEKSNEISELVERMLDLLTQQRESPFANQFEGSNVLQFDSNNNNNNNATFKEDALKVLTDQKFQDEFVTLVQSGVEKGSSQIANNISLMIVGESYYKWDSTSFYLPTIVCIFRELSSLETGIYRRTQVKLRFQKQTEDITNVDIQNLTNYFNNMKQFTYNHGNLRVNFVSKNRSCKTTIFVDTRDTAYQLLHLLCEAALIDFDHKDISFTEHRLRTSLTRRSSPLMGVEPYRVNYNATYPVKLYRAALLINGLSQPIILYQY